jgi:hypothetical protein
VHPELAGLQQTQRGVFRRSQARAVSYAHAEIERLLKDGDWKRVRHGVFTNHDYDPEKARRDRRMYLLAAAARLLVMRGDVMLSHAAAAAWHQVQVLDGWPAEPTITRHRPAPAAQIGARMTAHDLYVAPVPIQHRVPGVPVTSAARTVIDCARTFGLRGGLVTAESALRRGLDRDSLHGVLEACAGWPGIAEARRVVAFADEWSETAIESLTRLWCFERGLPAPRQQASVWSRDGRFLAEVDFVWEEQRTVLETDGRKKYTDEDGPVVVPKDGVVWKEKRREDDLRDVGLEVVRGYWEDVNGVGADLAGRLERAFARGKRAVEPPSYVLGPPIRRPARPLAQAG